MSLLSSPTRFGHCSTQEKGHGRLEKRFLRCCAIPKGYSRFPYAQHAFCLTREVKNLKTGHISLETVYGITSLPLVLPSQGDAFTNERRALARLAKSLHGYVRGHWSIENKSHYVRDVVWLEDSCRCHRGNLPQVLACFRHVAMNLIRLSGQESIAGALRKFAARPQEALELLGITKIQKTE